MPYSVTLMLMQIITMYTEALDAFNNNNPKSYENLMKIL